jgi:hypothetical protein
MKNRKRAVSRDNEMAWESFLGDKNGPLILVFEKGGDRWVNIGILEGGLVDSDVLQEVQDHLVIHSFSKTMQGYVLQVL